MRVVGGLQERCQSVLGLTEVRVRIREKGGSFWMCKVNVDVSFLIVREIGGMAIR